METTDKVKVGNQFKLRNDTVKKINSIFSIQRLVKTNGDQLDLPSILQDFEEAIIKRENEKHSR